MSLEERDLFADQFAGLPNDEEIEQKVNAAADELEAVAGGKPALPARLTRESIYWK